MSKGVAEMRRLCFDVEKVTLFCYNYKKSPRVRYCLLRCVMLYNKQRKEQDRIIPLRSRANHSAADFCNFLENKIENYTETIAIDLILCYN